MAIIRCKKAFGDPLAVLALLMLASFATWGQEVAPSARLKPGFRDMRWGDPPQAGWKLGEDKRHPGFRVAEVGSFKAAKQGARTCGVQTGDIRYLFLEGKLCGVSTSFAATYWPVVRDCLGKEWGAPVEKDGDGGRYVWRSAASGHETEAVLYRTRTTSASTFIFGNPTEYVALELRDMSCVPKGVDSGL